MRETMVAVLIICSSFFCSCVPAIHESDFIDSVHAFEDTADVEPVLTVVKKYPANFKKISQTLTPGFISGVLWIALEIRPPEASEKLVLDLGPEIVDRADLFVFDSLGVLVCGDSTGRTVPGSQRKIVSWRSALLVPPDSGLVFVRVVSSDSVHLTLRSFTPDDFYRQTSRFTFFHALVFGITGVIMLFLLISSIFFREKLFLFLFLANVFFLIYQFSMKGFIYTYAPVFSQSVFYAARISYLTCMAGFVIGLLLISKCIQSRKKTDLLQLYLHVTMGLIVFFALLYLFLPSLHRLYETSLVLLIFGCVITSVIIFILLVVRKKLSVWLLAAWIPFLVYVVFRQSYHIARLYFEFPRLQKIFDYDYYFSYDLCFLFQLVVYTWLIYKRVHETQCQVLIENERSYFFRTMTHELLAPATLVYQAAEELGQNIPQNKKIDNLLQSIRGNAVRIRETSVLINSLEEQEQNIDHMAEKQELVNPSEILADIITDYKWYAEVHQKPIQSIMQVSGCVFAYPLFLKNVFSNLIDNAVKYGREHFPVAVELFRQEDVLWFTVCSCGNLSAEEELQPLFDLDYRAPQAKKTAVAGFGIGLYLVNRIAKLYDGTVSVQNVTDSAGTNCVKFAVSLKLPFAADNAILPALNAGNPVQSAESFLPSAKVQELLAKSTILFVDDDVRFLEDLYKYFSPFCAVLTAVDGFDALEVLKTAMPDVIVCDLHMPRMDGLKLKEKCAQDNELDAIPFLFLSAAQKEHTIRRAYDQGIVDYITKPVRFEELQNKLFALLQLCQKIALKKTSAIIELIQNGQPLKENPAEQKKRAHAYRQELYKTYDLSPTEKKVCETFIDGNGKTNREIAETLYFSTDTAGTHLKNIYKKMSVKDRTELAVLLHSVK